VLGELPVIFRSPRHYSTFMLALLAVQLSPRDVAYRALSIPPVQAVLAQGVALYKLRKVCFVVGAVSGMARAGRLGVATGLLSPRTIGATSVLMFLAIDGVGTVRKLTNVATAGADGVPSARMPLRRVISLSICSWARTMRAHTGMAAGLLHAAHLRRHPDAAAFLVRHTGHALRPLAPAVGGAALRLAPSLALSESGAASYEVATRALVLGCLVWRGGGVFKAIELLRYATHFVERCKEGGEVVHGRVSGSVRVSVARVRRASRSISGSISEIGGSISGSISVLTPRLTPRLPRSPSWRSLATEWRESAPSRQFTPMGRRPLLASAASGSASAAASGSASAAASGSASAAASELRSKRWRGETRPVHSNLGPDHAGLVRRPPPPPRPEFEYG
jgi:hypothetical protein